MKIETHVVTETTTHYEMTITARALLTLLEVPLRATVCVENGYHGPVDIDGDQPIVIRWSVKVQL